MPVATGTNSTASRILFLGSHSSLTVSFKVRGHLCSLLCGITSFPPSGNGMLQSCPELTLHLHQSLKIHSHVPHQPIPVSGMERTACAKMKSAEQCNSGIKSNQRLNQVGEDSFVTFVHSLGTEPGTTQSKRGRR